MEKTIRKSNDHSPQERPVKRALLLTYIVEETNDIFDTLPNAREDYDTGIQRLKENFAQTENKNIALFDFR